MNSSECSDKRNSKDTVYFAVRRMPRTTSRSNSFSRWNISTPMKSEDQILWVNFPEDSTSGCVFSDGSGCFALGELRVACNSSFHDDSLMPRTLFDAWFESCLEEESISKPQGKYRDFRPCWRRRDGVFHDFDVAFRWGHFALWNGRGCIGRRCFDIHSEVKGEYLARLNNSET